MEKLREGNVSLTEKLDESERKKALLKTALAELNNTTTKQVTKRGTICRGEVEECPCIPNAAQPHVFRDTAWS